MRGLRAISAKQIAIVLGIGVFVGALSIRTEGAAVPQDQEAIYSRKCAICHARDGSGKTMMGKKYKVKDVREQIKKYSEKEMIKIVEEGKGTYMGSYRKALSPEQIKAVVEYYRGLAKSK